MGYLTDLLNNITSELAPMVKGYWYIDRYTDQGDDYGIPQEYLRLNLKTLLLGFIPIRRTVLEIDLMSSDSLRRVYAGAYLRNNPEARQIVEKHLDNYSMAYEKFLLLSA